MCCFFYSTYQPNQPRNWKDWRKWKRYRCLCCLEILCTIHSWNWCVAESRSKGYRFPHNPTNFFQVMLEKPIAFVIFISKREHNYLHHALLMRDFILVFSFVLCVLVLRNWYCNIVPLRSHILFKNKIDSVQNDTCEKVLNWMFSFCVLGWILEIIFMKRLATFGWCTFRKQYLGLNVQP